MFNKNLVTIINVAGKDNAAGVLTTCGIFWGYCFTLSQAWSIPVGRLPGMVESGSGRRLWAWMMMEWARGREKTGEMRKVFKRHQGGTWFPNQEMMLVMVLSPEPSKLYVHHH